MSTGSGFGGNPVAAAVAATTGTLVAAVNGAREVLPQPVKEALANRVLGISAWQYFAAFALVMLGLVLRRVIIYVLDRYKQWAKPAVLRLDERIVQAAMHPLGLAVVLLGVLSAVKALMLPEPIDRFATNLAISILIATAAWLLFNLTDVLVHYIGRLAGRGETALDDQLLPIIRKSAKILIVIVAGIQVIEQMGGDIKGLLAGLGLGGLAFALAARDSISNIFGSIVILADRPFRVGDWIEAQGQNIEGVVEEIGFRSTRIRTFAKSLVTVPNSVVANWAINNWSAMPKRRVKLTLNLAHGTTPRQVETTVGKMREVVRGHPMIDQEESPVVHLYDFGEGALQISVQYFTKTVEWIEYLTVREEVNLAIMRILEELGVSIALPSLSAHVPSPPPTG